jgi:formate dehydrogenase assembly factor FdhD
MRAISRRDFVAITAAGAAAAPFVRADGLVHAATAMTAGEIVDRIKKQIGVEWRSDDVDTFKAGDPSTVVTGVVTTSMATMEVLQKAVQAGANLIITAAPTFYSRADVARPGERGAGAGGAGRGAVTVVGGWPEGST